MQNLSFKCLLLPLLSPFSVTSFGLNSPFPSNFTVQAKSETHNMGIQSSQIFICTRNRRRIYQKYRLPNLILRHSETEPESMDFSNPLHVTQTKAVHQTCPDSSELGHFGKHCENYWEKGRLCSLNSALRVKQPDANQLVKLQVVQVSILQRNKTEQVCVYVCV